MSCTDAHFCDTKMSTAAAEPLPKSSLLCSKTCFFELWALVVFFQQAVRQLFMCGKHSQSSSLNKNQSSHSTNNLQNKHARIQEALRKNHGVRAERDGAFWRVQLDDDQAPTARVLLPDGFALEGEALQQLAALAAVRHPSGGQVAAAVASPDFHPGDAGIAIGSVAALDGIVIPAAVGTDINCGMRLHVADISPEQFLAKRDAFVDEMKHAYFLGGRDVPMTGKMFRALFQDGLLGLVEEWRKALHSPIGSSLGVLQKGNFAQIENELERVFGAGSLAGDARHAPEGLCDVDGAYGLRRDGGLATIGGGNHFVEVQSVAEVYDRAAAHRMGIRVGQIAFMVHSGSRLVGKHVGNIWREQARAAWPKNIPHPDDGLFALSQQYTPDLLQSYLAAEATAANYGFLNRLLLAEILRQSLRRHFGSLHRSGDIEAPLIYDLPHNITLPEESVAGGQFVVRKGACPAHAMQPVIVPGSMGDASFLLQGTGSAALLSSASHGAGRAKRRQAMVHAAQHVGKSAAALRERDLALGLSGVDCITLREERRIEEAPSAYKPVLPVVQSQVEAGAVSLVARLQPILTFKA